MPDPSEVKTLHPFQEEGIRRALAKKDKRLIFNFSTGLGKTATAINFARRIGARRILVFTASVVKQVWLDEIASWWPEHPSCATIKYVKERTKGLSKKAIEEKVNAYASAIQIVSYSLADNVDSGPWDLIILDESHRCTSPGAKQTRAVRNILRANPNAAALALTATLFPDRITDVWSQLDLLWPGRFGTTSKAYRYPSWYFSNRYSIDVGDEYGPKYFGINPVHEAELRRRLADVAHRVTKDEVAHLLPPFIVSLVKIEPDKDVAFGSVESWLDTQGAVKLPFVKSWLEDAIEDAKHICILTHLKQTVENIRVISEETGIPVYAITGEIPADERNATLQKAAMAPRSIVVATMHSVGIGINLGFCSRVLFSELYWRPETVIQALGRFDGFRTKNPTSADLLCVAGTTDEAMAVMLLKKIEAFNRAMKAGTAETKLVEALDGVNMSEEEAIASLNATLFQTDSGAYD
jgi:SNF2 family DNA or RNA helicase